MGRALRPTQPGWAQQVVQQRLQARVAQSQGPQVKRDEREIQPDARMQAQGHGQRFRIRPDQLGRKPGEGRGQPWVAIRHRQRSTEQHRRLAARLLLRSGGAASSTARGVSEPSECDRASARRTAHQLDSVKEQATTGGVACALMLPAVVGCC